MANQNLLPMCKQYFGTENLYEVLGIDKKASDKEVVAAYRRLSLKIHPDRVEEAEKEESTEKFKVLGKIHSVLSDPKKRKAYDDNGDLDEDVDGDWLCYWRSIFKPINEEDIKNYEQKYKGSEEERNDLKEAYQNYKGDMDKIMEVVLFTQLEDEPRLCDILNDMIEKGEIEDFPAFSKETEKKKKRRETKMKRQRSQFEKMSKKKKAEENGADDFASLQMAIAQNRANREGGSMGFIEALERKYANQGKEKPATTRTSGRRKK